MSRPLSAWVAYVDAGVLGPVNNGDDRLDARGLDDFAFGWDRAAVQWHGGRVLGLRNEHAEVVELDSYGNPIPVTLAGAALLAELDEGWPRREVDVAELAGEAVAVRYWLLARLDAEGDPDDEAFALLPWDLVERAVTAIEKLLANGTGELVELRHWFNPAAAGLAGPLEQLDHGLRTADAVTAREGATTLLDNLRDMPLRRIPPLVRARLAVLARRLSFVDAGLAESAAARLTSQNPDELTPTWFTARLVGSTHLSNPDTPPSVTATLEFDGREARGTVALTAEGLVVTLRGVDLQVTVETPGGREVTMIRRGQSHYAVVPWESSALPDHLVFREAGSR